MIGYYVHHVGSGHLNRARAIAAVTGAPVVGLSSLSRPHGWVGDWVVLDRDDRLESPLDVTAHGHLHWVPRGDLGLRRRSAQLSTWIEEARPEVLVSDVSVEVAVLARLHGVPVVSYLMPGNRTDPGHLLGYGVSDAIVACWPEHVSGMTPGLPNELRERVTCVGAMSRLPVSDTHLRSAGGPRVTVLLGSGGGQPSADLLEQARVETPDWEWTVLGQGHRWTDDVRGLLLASDVVVTQAGENAIAEVAACRRPAVVIPAERPHDEQATTAQVLAHGEWPVVVEPTFPTSGWPERLSTARQLDPARWSAWCDGKAAERISDLLDSVAR